MVNFVLKSLMIILVVLAPATLNAQKKTIDTTLFFNWPSVPDWYSHAVSNNGQYVLYPVQNMPMHSNTTIVQALNRNWQVSLTGVTEALFTNDSKQVIYMGADDSLCLLSLVSQQKKYIPSISTFKLITLQGQEWLVCQTSGMDKGVVLYNVASGATQRYANVDGYFYSENGAAFVLKIDSPVESGKETLQWIDLRNQQSKFIFKGAKISNLCFDNSGSRLAFFSVDDNIDSIVIRIYDHASGDLLNMSNNLAFEIPAGMQMASIHSFSEDRRSIFIQLKQKKIVRQPVNAVPLNIWSYTDIKLQPQQLREYSLSDSSFLAVVDLQQSFALRQLQMPNDVISEITNDYILFRHSIGNEYERYWNEAVVECAYLVSIKDGIRKPVPFLDPQFSSDNKYIIGNSSDHVWGCDLYTYDISSAKLINITVSMPIPLQSEERDIPSKYRNRGLQLAGWFPGDNWVLVYDDYDLWKVDPKGQKLSVKLTNGREKKIKYRLAEKGNPYCKMIITSQHLMLTAFNKVNKESGFYRLSLDNNRLEKLSMGNYLYQRNFLKAKDADVYLVTRQRSDDSPNIFSTSDFKTFKPVSQVYPEKRVNWFDSELVEFLTVDGLITRGILYKPQDFDSMKKYPLIIHYYDKKSDDLNIYQHPIPESGGDLDIAWFASHGYLVLLTDIHFKVGEPGESALHAVEGAVKYLSQRRYIDQSHIGLQGHSFGGYETNYIVTHSKLFAAAVSSAGMVDIASDYGNLWLGVNSKQEYFETRDGRLGVTPWDVPEVYVKNSPIYYTGKAETPLLLVHGRKDVNVYFEQGLEFFTALRRAGKRAWLLEYENANHHIRSGDTYKDYLFRMSQFFDHYLKDSLAPRWMTRGIPAARKGYEDGFELDDEIKTPPEGGLLIESLRYK